VRAEDWEEVDHKNGSYAIKLKIGVPKGKRKVDVGMYGAALQDRPETE